MKRRHMKLFPAKKLIIDKLKELNLPYEKVTARTVSFSDLARDSKPLIIIHGWQPNPLWNKLLNLAKANNFCITNL
jgi:hypothetical protein